MQGGYEKTATIMRQITEMRNEGLLDNVLEFTDVAVQPKTVNWVRTIGDMIRTKYGENHGAASISSTVKTTIPTFLGVDFKAYEPPPPSEKGASRIAQLEERVAVLEEQMRELMPSLS